MGDLIFITGGVRSGKSTFAEKLATEEDIPTVYLATLEPLDLEMKERIHQHQKRRPSHWKTIETKFDIAKAYQSIQNDHCILFDCLSMWVTNQLLIYENDLTSENIEKTYESLFLELSSIYSHTRNRSAKTIIVSNEVGGGIVPTSKLARVYRDMLGTINQSVASHANDAWLLVAGRPIKLP